MQPYFAFERSGNFSQSAAKFLKYYLLILSSRYFAVANILIFEILRETTIRKKSVYFNNHSCGQISFFLVKSFTKLNHQTIFRFVLLYYYSFWFQWIWFTGMSGNACGACHSGTWSLSCVCCWRVKIQQARVTSSETRFGRTAEWVSPLRTFAL